MLSIVIPTRDRPAQLRGCLEALAGLGAAQGEIEVIVVDDGSRLPIADLITAFDTRLALRAIRQGNAGPASARNAGAELARGEWLAFLDDDCVVAADWWAQLSESCRENRGAMIGGPAQNRVSDNRYAVCHQLLLDYLYEQFNRQPQAATFCASNNLAVPAADFRVLGGFDASFPFPAGEDRDFCDRWRASGRPIVHVRSILVHHTHRMTLASFWRQHYRYGRGASRYHQRRSERGSAGVSIESPRFYLGLLAFPLRRVSFSELPGAVGLLLLTQLATACGYAVERVHGSSAAR